MGRVEVEIERSRSAGNRGGMTLHIIRDRVGKGQR